MQNQRNTGVTEYEARVSDPALKWGAPVALGTASSSWAEFSGHAPIILFGDAGRGSEERIVIAGVGDTITAVNAASGDIVWKHIVNESTTGRLTGRFTAANIYTDGNGTTEKTILFTTEHGIHALPLKPTGSLDQNNVRTDSTRWSVLSDPYGDGLGGFHGGIAVINLTDAELGLDENEIPIQGTKSLAVTTTFARQDSAGLNPYELSRHKPVVLAIDATGDESGNGSGQIHWASVIHPALDHDDPQFTGAVYADNISTPAVGAGPSSMTRNVYTAGWISGFPHIEDRFLTFTINSNGHTVDANGTDQQTPAPSWTGNISVWPHDQSDNDALGLTTTPLTGGYPGRAIPKSRG